MSPKPKSKKVTVPELVAMKGRGEKITMVTCYDATFMRILDQAGVEMVLVGDSLGMVIQGRSSTLEVTLEDMIYHGRIVARGLTHAHLVNGDRTLGAPGDLVIHIDQTGQILDHASCSRGSVAAVGAAFAGRRDAMSDDEGCQRVRLGSLQLGGEGEREHSRRVLMELGVRGVEIT